MVPTIDINAIQVLALCCFGFVLGGWCKRRLPVLDRLNIPASIIGGLVFAIIITLCRDRLVNFNFDRVLQDILMVAFFTTIGMSASLQLVRVGGVQVVIFLVIATAGAFLQNVVGISLAKAMGIDPLLGIISGSVALTGGPATALAFGKSFEEMGVAGATTLGVASAMFGITAGGLLGGWIGGTLIQKHRLLASAAAPSMAAVAGSAATASVGTAALGGTAVVTRPPLTDTAELQENEEQSSLLNTVILIAIAMGLGTLVSFGLNAVLARWKIFLPAYIGAMIVAAVLRNLDDKFHFAKISSNLMDEVGNVALYIFIVMALLTLRLWELVNLAGPLLILLLAQLVLVYLMCVFLSFRSMGKNYESAVMAGGFCGFMLGTTANAMACMTVLRDKYGPAPRAFIVVPLVGASLIDFVNAILITQMANIFR